MGTLHSRVDVRKWLFAPVVTIVVVIALVTNWPEKLRFALSVSAFNNALTKIQTKDPASVPGQWIGLYYVTRVSRQVDGALFLEVGLDLTDIVGLVFRGSGPPTQVPHRDMGFGWYLEWN